MKKIRIGVMGAYRGSSMINYCKASEKAEVVAICDKWEEVLERQRQNLNDSTIAYYKSFEEFIEHDMDAVVLANYANEHAPFAIRCLNRGLHVFSEVLPCQTMKEAVELIETVERTGKVYAYGENYCYMPGPYEMKKLYRNGKIGEFEYGEGEYIHNCEPIWPSITYGDRNHWRNNMHAFYYCTHSLGPLIHITGLRPVSVTGFESQMTERHLRCGSKAGQYGIEMVTLENGGIIKSIHGGLYKDSVWYCIYGSKGRMETARGDTKCGDVSRIYINKDEYSGEYGKEHIENYIPETQIEASRHFDHSGSDFYCMDEFIKKIAGEKDADIIDIYEAMDMFLPGLFAYRSVLKGGVTVAIPDFRNPAIRGQYRNDTACTIPEAAGDMLQPVFSKGTPDIPDTVYEIIKKRWKTELLKDDSYSKKVTIQGLDQTANKN